jgi:ribonuclease D
MLPKPALQQEAYFQNLRHDLACRRPLAFTLCMISKTEDLQTLYDASKQTGLAALDTEFVWERTYYPILGLLQVGLGPDANHLIDTPQVGDATPMASLMADASIVKILHDAPQDLTIIKTFCGSLPCNVFDTRLAAGFAGMSSTLSLAALVEELCGVTLDKSATRTNWLRRPLSAVQLDYAIDDVKYLPEIRDTLLSRLNDQSRAWLEEEHENLSNPSNFEQMDPELAYKKVKGTRDVPKEHQGVLIALAEWRETEARRSDRPRGHVMDDRHLTKIAQLAPVEMDKLQEAMKDMPHALKSLQPDLLDSIAKGLDSSGIERGQPRPRVDRNRLREAGNVLRKLADERALEVGIDSMLLGSRKDLEAVFYSALGAPANGNRLLKGWRRELIGNELLAKAESL